MNLRHKSFSWWLYHDLGTSLLFTGIGALAFGSSISGNFLFRLISGLFASFVISLCFCTVLAVSQTWLFPRLKFPSFIASVICISIGYLASLLLGFGLGISLSLAFLFHKAPWDPQIVSVVRGVLSPELVAIAFAGMILINFYFNLSSKLGPGVLTNWMLGRYHRPREEQRVFMFLDMRDSTKLGEELGDLKFSALIQQFFADISEPILKSKGEVSHYIGDEVVLTWKIHRKIDRNASLKCFFNIKDAIAAKAESYLSKFGTVPGFKAGVHIGTVVATQVGEIKSEIVYHGDVLNTTARTQSMCNALDSELLITKSMKDFLDPDPTLTLSCKGHHEMKGKELAVELWTVERLT